MQTLRSARRHQALSALLAQRAATQAAKAGRELDVVQIALLYQIAQARLSDQAVTQILAEQRIEAPAEAVLNPRAFTTDPGVLAAMIQSAGQSGIPLLVGSLVQSAGRAAESVATAIRNRIGHVRTLRAPSCSRCAVLAGRVYHYSEGFQRHPHCDCTMTPVREGDDVYAIDPVDLVRRGKVTDLSKADTQALRDGADFNRLVNVRRSEAGLQQPGRVLARRGRPTIEGIYKTAATREEAVALLEENGYILQTSRTTVLPTVKVAERTPASVAEDLVTAARAAEPQLTTVTSDLAERFGGRMEGLDFRLKTADSLARKLEAEVVESGGTLTATQAGAKMFDVNRYTSVYPEAGYAHGVQASLDALRADGYQLKVKNYWNVETNPYQGVNVQIVSPQGQKFELQFHTDDSLRVKEGELHHIYELQRVETSAAKREEYAQQMFDVAAKIPVPPGIHSVS